MAGDDAFLIVVRYFPILFVVAGVLVVVWFSRQRLPHELESDVLAALSETEALTPMTIRQRPPLDYQDVDVRLIERVLERLCMSGLAVRWYDTSNTSERCAVYRRVRSVPLDGGGVK